jgi:hypothetical protein
MGVRADVASTRLHFDTVVTNRAVHNNQRYTTIKRVKRLVGLLLTFLNHIWVNISCEIWASNAKILFPFWIITALREGK